VLGEQAVLAGSVSVTAKDHTAPITLGRGGTVRVCQTSVLHVTESRAVEVAAPLLFSLDRGAIEIDMTGSPSDAIMTPDLRFTVRNAGPLDLRLRIARNGDTCVENRGPGAPTLAVSDPFGDSMYELQAGQHVLFEHGSLHEVVDNESIPCGCPEAREGISVAEALLAPGSGGNTDPAPAAPASAPAIPAAVSGPNAAAHTFPAAASEGLTPVAEVPQASTGKVRPQISDTLVYNAPALTQPADSASGKQSAQTTGAAIPTPASTPLREQAHAANASFAPVSAHPANPPAAPVPPANDLVHLVGRFFRKIFGRH